MQFQKKATTTLHVKECKRAITWRGAQYSELNSCTTLPSSVFVGWFRFWLPVFYLQSFHFYFVIVFLFLSKFVFLFFSLSLEIFVSIYSNDAFLFKLHCLLRDDRSWYQNHFSIFLEHLRMKFKNHLMTLVHDFHPLHAWFLERKWILMIKVLLRRLFWIVSLISMKLMNLIEIMAI